MIIPEVLSTFPAAQFLIIDTFPGPVPQAGKGSRRMLAMKRDPRFRGRLFVPPYGGRAVSYDTLKFAADVCLVPHRDEINKDIDVEFVFRGGLPVHLAYPAHTQRPSSVNFMS